jgi:CubicO group peptidase (beta-lactamase class C family)/predicted esterase
MKFKIAYLLILLLGNNCLFGQLNSSCFSKTDSLLSTETSKPFSGVVLIGQQKEKLYLKTFGYSDREKQIPIQENDQFVIGSISKQFTAVLVLREYDKGHLKLHEPIRKYLPELTQSWADTVTVHFLLTHTHGITGLDEPTFFKVGSQYAYSQIGYDILASITERTSGKTFATQSAELFNLCGMKNTFHPDIKKYTHLVKGYTEEKDGNIEFDSTSFQNSAAASSFISTAVDLLIWNNCFYAGKLLKKETMKLLTTKHEGAVRQHPIFGKTCYGYGITIDTENELLQWGQTGFAPGFISMNFYFPETQTSVIVLENVAYDTDHLKKTFQWHIGILNIVRENLLLRNWKTNAQTVSKPKANYPYLLYLPKEHSTSKKDFPLVIYLGGGSQRGNDLNKLKTYGIPFYIEQGHEYDFIIASPQCPDDKYWTTENWFESLYADLTSKYRIDTTRIYVTGISVGGFGTWQVAMDYPDKFAAIVPLCGGVNDSDMANISRLKELSIWAFHGTMDDMIPISDTEKVVSKLGEYGRIKFTRLQNEGHGIQYLYADNIIFDWLLLHHKKNDSDKE